MKCFFLLYSYQREVYIKVFENFDKEDIYTSATDVSLTHRQHVFIVMVQDDCDVGAL